jgi:hypothetical protein
MDKAIESILERYEQARIQCLRWANLHPGSSSVCHQSLHHHPQGVGARELFLAALCDDMALCIKQLRAAEIGKAIAPGAEK